MSVLTARQVWRSRLLLLGLGWVDLMLVGEHHTRKSNAARVTNVLNLFHITYIRAFSSLHLGFSVWLPGNNLQHAGRLLINAFTKGRKTSASRPRIQLGIDVKIEDHT